MTSPADEAPALATGAVPRWVDAARHGAAVVSALMFVVVFAIFLFKIASRYGEGDPAAWADELCVVLFIWMIFWANAFVLRESDQIRFDLFTRAFPPAGRRVLAVLRLLLIGGIFVWALPEIVDYIAFLWRERTPVLRLRLDLVYACFGLFVAAVVARSLWGLGQMLGPHWRRHV